MSKPTIICLGEVLWDLLPSGKIAGGAPMNVAFHANQFGLHSKMISRVGQDGLGEELLGFLNQKGVSTELVQTDGSFPTGIVNVILDEKGSPSYEIVQPAAWDYIQSNSKMQNAVEQADVLVFGSLACRNGITKNTLLELLKVAKLRVLDVNLRQPYYSNSLLEDLLIQADIVKMNDEELELISGYWIDLYDPKEQMVFLSKKFGLQKLIVTCGSNGAACLDESGYHEQSGFPVTVKDTIGSGDSFLAAFLSKMLTGENAADCLRFACAIGALVATKQGGTPVLEAAEIEAILRSKTLTTN
ncbi:MAG: carbohydrate kinase [Bacteroidetes bacterium]|nr:carbohydrate kinase [Bacteroidota bacterium]